MKWLKRLGRCWAIVTHDDQRLDPDGVRAVLLIHRPEDRHLAQAVAACRRRFPRAALAIASAQEAPGACAAPPAVEFVRLPARGGWRALRAHLRRWRTTPQSLLVWLSLHPVAVALGYLEFPGPRLLFNRWGQWFLVRPRTVAELVTLRPGADRPASVARRGARWGWLRLLAVPWRFLALTGQVAVALIGIGWRRWRYRRRHASPARAG